MQLAHGGGPVQYGKSAGTSTALHLCRYILLDDVANKVNR